MPGKGGLSRGHGACGTASNPGIPVFYTQNHAGKNAVELPVAVMSDT